MHRKPPRKQNGQAAGPRRIDGEEVLDVRGMKEYGMTRKTTYARVSRGLLPFRKWGGRIIFLRSEVEQFLRQLPGVTVDEALENDGKRRGQ